MCKRLARFEFATPNRTSSVCTLILYLSLAAASGAQQIRLIRDFVQSESSAAFGFPRFVALVGQRLLIGNDISAEGGLWSFELSGDGARHLIGHPQGSSRSGPEPIATNGEVLLLEEHEGVHQRIWRTDGSDDGTYLLLTPEDVPSWSRVIPPGVEYAPGGQIVFVGYSDDWGSQLWATDGTRKGTHQISFSDWGAQSYAWDTSVVALDEEIVLFRRLGASSFVVWFTDGTVAGTRPVKTIDGSVGPLQAWAAGSRLFFVISTPSANRRLWTSDGSEAGTYEVPIPEPIPRVQYRISARHADLAYFIGSRPGSGDELWRSDGTSIGTFPITDLPIAEPFGSYEFGVHASDSGIYFQASWDDPEHLLYMYAAADGAVPVTLLGPEAPSIVSLEPRDQTIFPLDDGRVAFLAYSEETGTELWSSDGSSEGTFAVTEFGPGSQSGGFRHVRGSDGVVYFEVESEGQGSEIWAMTSAAAGAHRVTDFLTSQPFSQTFSGGNEPLVYAGSLWLVAKESPNGNQLWQCSLEGGGQRAVSRIGISSPSSWPKAFGGSRSMFGFDICDTGQAQLWTSDGTGLGTRQIPVPAAYCIPGWPSSGSWKVDWGNGSLLFEWRSITLGGQIYALERDLIPRQLTWFETGWQTEGVELDGGFLFGHNSGTSLEMWRLDVPAGESERLAVLDVPPNASRTSAMIGAGAFAFLVADRSGSEGEIWQSNGKAEGTFPVGVIERELAVSYSSWSPISLRGDLFFGAADAEGTGLFRYSPASGALDRVTPNDLQVESGRFPPLPFGQSLLFAASQGEEWFLGTYSPDSGEIGLVPLPGRLVETWDERGWATDGRKVVFSLTTDQEGREPWVSDGTLEGTELLKDIDKGVFSSSPEGFTATPKGFIFTAFEPTTGREFWLSNGTAESTELLADLASGGTSASPWGQVLLGTVVPFTAFRSELGYELWLLDFETDPSDIFRDDFESNGLWNWEI